MAKITIELRSDLCAASGEGHASVIDTDVAYDSSGIPYIPSRRIKGCLREAAELIRTDEELLSAIFGKSGDSYGGALSLSDAFLPDSDEIREQTKGRNPEKVLSLFASVRASTAVDVDSGTAKEESLRFMRVVGKYSLVDKKPLVFEAWCEIDSKYDAQMEKICKALRNIGYKRNRGFGAVKCAFEPTVQSEMHENFSLYEQQLEAEKEYEAHIKITNILPLILSQTSEDDTLDFISGTMLQGLFAWRYPDKQSEAFREIFARGAVRFSSCLPGKMPIPSVYSKMKKSEAYVNSAECSSGDAQDDDTSKRDTPKPIKKGYMDRDGNLSEEAKKEVVYHNSTGSGLYMQTALSAGQTFYGTISGKGKYIDDLFQLFPDGNIRLGRSRGAQYGHCELSVESISEKDQSVLELNGETLVVVMCSDVSLYDGAISSCDVKVLNKEVLAAIGQDLDIAFNDKKSSFGFAVRGGYSGIWNLKKPQFKVFTAGSTLVYDNVTGKIPENFTIGAKQGEGFGICLAMRLSEMPGLRKAESQDAPDDESSPQAEGEYSKLISESKLVDDVIKSGIFFSKRGKSKLDSPLDQIRALLSSFVSFVGYKNKLDISMSQLSRIRRMAEEAKSKDDFDERVKSIKTEAVMKAVRDFVKRYDETLKTAAGDVAQGRGNGEIEWSVFRKGLDAALREQIYREKLNSGGDE